MLTTLRRQTATGLRVLLVMTVLCGIVYPLAIWGVSRIPGLSAQAEGSVLPGGTGSSLIGIDPVAADPAADPYFHTRPSATAEADAGLGPADTTTSGGSNKGGFDTGLLEAVQQRRAVIAAREGVDPAAVPTDAVTASGSGLDPDISPAYAALQAPRVARVTGLSLDRVEQLVADATSGRTLGFLGEPRVDVTELNLSVRDAR
ncbi:MULTISPECIES: potassium-transporting ATPase subunit C [Pseudonocardia]|uniref:potassium-transporting ATPase subunit C n=1 Tax=Pseudonocardia TaxID=1847 RepID=UPI001AD72AA4|nr:MULTISPECIES: potassium-transporting ATPase subunit C [Pseudonocardia]MBO4238213.1 potassium-transporting ATPase subunit C [Pseudonocardia alni]MCM3847555.1 potassium-transporting ATPase subunit C [Pseudonocardia sp. DR1-2]